ncbi:hypothetical protein GH714_000179 [Hevea brasiliensis]|uniref:Uncharacterized protein n=1 Tax=Hevea brasiliensis TaxID=3981 RepID=A0A6A6MAM9_HEVBR|nr:hypothetical protein GH714_000179 [Hevea brasiliensis]
MGKEEIVVDDCVDEFELGGEGSDTDHTNGMSEELLEDSILDAIDSELDIVFSEEEVSQEDSISEGEIVSELVESDVEVPNNVALQAEAKENNEVQVMHLSSGRQEHSMQQHTEANKMTVHEGSSRDIVECEEPTPKAVNEEPTHIAVDEELTHKAVDEETTRNAVDDEPIRNAVDEEPAQFVVDEEPTHKAVDGNLLVM